MSRAGRLFAALVAAGLARPTSLHAGDGLPAAPHSSLGFRGQKLACIIALRGGLGDSSGAFFAESAEAAMATLAPKIPGVGQVGVGQGTERSAVGDMAEETEVQGMSVVAQGHPVALGDALHNEGRGAWFSPPQHHAGTGGPKRGAPDAASEREALGQDAERRRGRKRASVPAADSPEKYFRSVLSLDPTDADLMCEYAEALARAGPVRHADAETHFLRALNIKPYSQPVLNRYGKFLERERGNPKDAEAVYNKAIDADPNSACLVLTNLASLVLSEYNDTPRAEKLLLRALALEPTNTHALNSYGLFLHSSGAPKEIEEAEELFRIAIAIDDKQLDAMNNLAVLLETVHGDMSAAQELYRRALSVDERHAPTLSNLAHNLHALRQDDGAAEAMYKRAVAANPRHTNTLANYAYFLHHVKRDFNGAHSMYKAAIQVSPSHDSTLVNYAHLNVAEKNFQLAEALYRRALQINPSHILALCNYAAMLVKLSDEGKDGLLGVVGKVGDDGAEDELGVAGAAKAAGGHPASEAPAFFSKSSPSERNALGEALELLKRAKALQPDFPPVADHLNTLMGKLGHAQIPPSLLPRTGQNVEAVASAPEEAAGVASQAVQAERRRRRQKSEHKQRESESPAAEDGRTTAFTCLQVVR